MENKESSEEQKPMTYEDIIKEGEGIYPLLDDVEKKSFEINNVKNWVDVFYTIKQGKTKLKFNELISKSEYSKFFEGLNYEYGINDKNKDIQKAFEIYKSGAENDIDVMCMYKLYHIYKNLISKKETEFSKNFIYSKLFLF